MARRPKSFQVTELCRRKLRVIENSKFRFYFAVILRKMKDTCKFVGCSPQGSESSESSESHFDYMVDALGMIGEDIPKWVKDPFCFDTANQVEKYYKRGPHSLHSRKAYFRDLFESNPMVRLKIRVKSSMSQGYVEGVLVDLIQYIDEVFNKKAKYYEHEGVQFLLVFSR
jgi:hypothetical protein